MKHSFQLRVLSSKVLSVAFCSATLMGALSGATSMAQVLLPVPFSTAIAGLPSGGTGVACTTTLPTAAGVSVPGDGCPANQATLNAPYGANVDSYGNIYLGDYNTYSLRVVYMGGANLAAAIQAANPTQTITPKVGYMYTLAGSRTAAIASTQGTTGGKMYYCNGAGSGIVGLGSNGDNCPATYAYLKPRSPVVDANGNVFFSSAAGGAPVRVVYVGGTAVANLITTLFPGTTPQVGFVYSIIKSAANGYNGDGLLASNATVATYSPRDIALDSKGNIYLSDGTNSFTAPNYASNNNIRRVDGVTGIITTYAGSPGCAQGTTAGCAGVFGGDGGAPTSASFNSPYTIFFDKNDNLYITDYNDGRLRVVYQAGTLPGIASPTMNTVYTVAGGGTLTASGSPASQLALGIVYVGGIDAAGNLYFFDGTSKYFWRVDATTGIATIIVGNKAQTTGAFCNGTNGPIATDKLGDGCPGPQSAVSSSGKLPFDKFGNFYEIESGNNVLRKFSYNTLFPATATGTNATQPLAFTSLAALTLTSESFSVDGGATAEYADGGNDTCALNAAQTAGAVCVFNVKFTPTQSGLRRGDVQFATATATAANLQLGGTGVAANTSVDPASTSTLGTGITPGGLTVDSNLNVYASDTSGNKVVKITSGGTISALMIGLSKPAQVAVDGAGNVLVADTGNNRIAKTTAAGGTITALGTGLSSPQGVAVDSVGDIFIADTGNNRVVEIMPNGGQVVANITGLSSPTRVAVDASNDLFVIDSGNNRVVELPVASEQVAINLGVTAVTPVGIAVDAAGDLYLADTASQSVVEFSPGVTNSNALVTGLTTPKGVAVDLNGTLYVADASLTGVLVANRTLPVTDFPNTNLTTSNTSPLNVTNTGNAALLFNGAQLTTATGNTAVFTVTPSTTNGCALATPIAPGSACGLTATFTPAVKGNYSETVAFVTNAADVGPSGALLTGTGVFLVATTTKIAVTSPTTATINYAQAVTLSITITPATNAGAAPTGTVKLTVDGKLQSQALPASGVVTITLNPAVGTHVVSASYGGDTLYASSSSSFSFTVLKAVTTTTLALTVGQAGSVPTLTFTGTTSSTTATGETGTISFYAGTQLIGTANVNSAGLATLTTQTTVYASYSFTAVYSGDANFSGSTSAVMTPKPDFTVVSTALVVTVPQGGVATLAVNITPLYNYTGSITASCTGLPLNSVCRFSPASLSVTAPTSGSPQAQAFTAYIYTSVDATQASVLPPEPGGGHRGVYAALAGPLVALLVLMVRRRRGFAQRLQPLAVMLFAASMSFGILGMAGCGKAIPSAASFTTPTGTSTVMVTFADSTGVSHSLTYTINVNAAYPLP